MHDNRAVFDVEIKFLSLGYGHSGEMGFLISKTRAKHVFPDVCMPTH